jgi:hypothetical protein
MKRKSGKLNSYLKSTFAIGVVLLFTSVNSYAHELKAVMKEMKSTINQISRQVSDANQNQSSAQLCDQLIAGIEHSKTMVPHKVSAMPADQQPEQIQAYVQALTNLEAKVEELKSDFVQGDNASAVQALNEIAVLKSAGHKAFKGSEH